MSLSSPQGTYNNTSLQTVHFGPGIVSAALPASLAKLGAKKAFVLTGNSLATKTDIIKDIQSVLGDAHGTTFHSIGEHAPVSGIRDATNQIKQVGADVIVAVGGGSPIDAAKAISYFIHENDQSTKGNDHPDSFIPIIAIPTTLSVAETTANAGYKSDDGDKIGVHHPAVIPRTIIYDAQLTLATPQRLWLSTGMRAVDHAIEFLYRFDTHPLLRGQVYNAIRELFTFLPLSKRSPDDVDIRQRLQLAAFISLWPELRRGALGLSHGLGHKLGATYAIGHGITSCLTLSPAIIHTAQSDETPLEALAALAGALEYIPAPFNPSPQPLAPAVGSATSLDAAQLRSKGAEVGKAVDRLVRDLDLHVTLKSQGVPREDLEKITQRTLGADKPSDSDEYRKILELLEGIYDDQQGQL
ncbi:uncharacterized protein PFL1_00751 [Pseudozyma flocculosa PF-1]|uniref:Related to Lactaldehyde reductase n=1 Tax=Pseudozyma flocculosa TaxID=84751 RepID=A0A5C3F2Q9_9BASI|nr:uncharacterized protein PFL1_00751 [Pseudozyma flocculosa PF-1]EPQ31416.1 hypothetical protein PFL1_00751 [Pseudozyma flocculosa PF-1]SPO38803.1 related to Lactaldehyde reductase [Pseudozyma flocculosa]